MYSQMDPKRTSYENIDKIISTIHVCARVCEFVCVCDNGLININASTNKLHNVYRTMTMDQQ